MTKILLTAGLLCCFLSTVFAQHFSDRHVFDLNKLQQSITKLQPPEILKKNPLEKFPDQIIKDVRLFSSSDSLLLSEIPDRLKFTPGHTGFMDNMPVVLPRGHYPSIIIKPDSTSDYMLIIKKP